MIWMICTFKFQCYNFIQFCLNFNEIDQRLTSGVSDTILLSFINYFGIDIDGYQIL